MTTCMAQDFKVCVVRVKTSSSPCHSCLHLRIPLACTWAFQLCLPILQPHLHFRPRCRSRNTALIHKKKSVALWPKQPLFYRLWAQRRLLRDFCSDLPQWTRWHRHGTVVLVRCGTRRWAYQKSAIFTTVHSGARRTSEHETNIPFSWRKVCYQRTPFFTRTSNLRPVYQPSSNLSQKRKSSRDLENEQIRILLERQKRANSCSSQIWDPEAQTSSRVWHKKYPGINWNYWFLTNGNWSYCCRVWAIQARSITTSRRNIRTKSGSSWNLYQEYARHGRIAEKSRVKGRGTFKKKNDWRLWGSKFILPGLECQDSLQPWRQRREVPRCWDWRRAHQEFAGFIIVPSGARGKCELVAGLPLAKEKACFNVHSQFLASTGKPVDGMSKKCISNQEFDNCQFVANFSTCKSGACFDSFNVRATCNSFSVRWRLRSRWKDNFWSGLSKQVVHRLAARLTDPSDVFLQNVHTMGISAEAPPRRLQHAHVCMNPIMHRTSRNPIYRRRNWALRLNLFRSHDRLDQRSLAVLDHLRPLTSIVCKASMFQRIVVSAGPLVNHVGIDVFAQDHDQAAQPRASLRAREAALCCGNHTSGQLRRTRHRIVRCHGGWSECRHQRLRHGQGHHRVLELQGEEGCRSNSGSRHLTRIPVATSLQHVWIFTGGAE